MLVDIKKVVYYDYQTIARLNEDPILEPREKIQISAKPGLLKILITFKGT